MEFWLLSMLWKDNRLPVNQQKESLFIGVTMNICSIEDCNNKHSAKGLCKKHRAKQYYQDTKEARKIREYNKYCKTCGKLIHFKSTYCGKCKQLGDKNNFYRKHHSEEILEKTRGANSPHWKGGITLLYEAIRHCFEYRQWRSDVFTRDNFACQICGDAIGGNLRAHHKVEFADITERHEITTLEEALKCEELWNINNGQTLCEDCHIDWHKNLNFPFPDCLKVI